MVFLTDGQLSEDQIEDTVMLITGIKPEQVEASINAKVRPSTDMKSSRVRLDKTRQRFIWEMESEVDGEPWMLTTYGFFGRRSIVQLAFYDRRDRPAAGAEAVLANSFKFDADSSYDTKLNLRESKWPENVGRGIGFVLVMYLGNLFRKVFKKKEKPAPAE